MPTTDASILTCFLNDLDKAKELVALLKEMRSFEALPPPTPFPTDPFGGAAAKVYLKAKMAVTDLPVLCGGLHVAVGGRFESFVREVFEDVADSIAAKAVTYDRLPEQTKKAMRDTTLEAIQYQQRYEFSDSEVAEFVQHLAESMTGTATALNVNSRCMSITSANMRSATFKDLIKRIGFSDIWDRMSQQASVLTYCATMNPKTAANLFVEKLDSIMRQRNLVAHPKTGWTWSSGMTWTTLDQIELDLEFLRIFATEFHAAMRLYESTWAPATPVPSPPSAPLACAPAPSVTATIPDTAVPTATLAAPTGST